jgi:hypothetical protein
MDIKPQMPRNGRLAYSVLTACRTGKLNRNYADQNLLFGWCIDTRNKHDAASRVSINLGKVMRAIKGRIAEKSGPCPSLKTGWEYLSAESRDKTVAPNSKDLAQHVRMEPLLRRFSPLIQDHAMCGMAWHCAPSHLRFLRQLDPERRISDRKIRVYHKIAWVTMGTWHNANYQDSGNRPNNDTLTTLTGPVVHHQGDDYYAPCVYSKQQRGSYSNEVRSCRMKVGHVLFRRGWPDMVHVEGPLNHVTLSSTLDTASNTYFENLRRQANAKLTEAERIKEQDKRIARMMKRLRRLFVPFTREDSYVVGNCKPGTEAFINSLKQNGGLAFDDLVCGPDLARCWWKSKYLQIDRFESVILRMEKVQAEQISRAFDSVVALFPAWDSISNEWVYLPEFPVENNTGDGDRNSGGDSSVGRATSLPERDSYVVGSTPTPCS